MKLEIEKVRYHRGEKEVIPIDEAQALLIVSDVITASLAQNGFTCTITVK